MGCLKNYLLTVLENCSDEQFGQEAVEWAILTGRVVLTYDLETDLKTIMGCVPHGPSEPNRGSETNYDRIIEAYRRQCQEHGDALVELYHASGLMEEILRPIPLATAHNATRHSSTESY
jgi:hypothetical protein